MTEPISSTAAGLMGWKILSSLAGMGAIGAALASFVVMSMTRPRTDREWRVALVCTLVGSIGGGSALVMHLGLQHWALDPFGLVALMALMFACGLPAWALVRALFKYLNKHRGADILEIVKDVRGAL